MAAEEPPTGTGSDPADEGRTPSTPSPLVPVKPTYPQQIDGYRILERLGSGGMGVVYLAEDEHLKRRVALKMIQAGPELTAEQMRRFQTEARALSQLQHPHVVQIYAWGEHHGRPYFVMEYVAGGCLRQRLQQGLPAPHDAAHLAEVLASTLHAVHGKGILHRDVKPDNVLLAEPVADGPNVTALGLPKLSDFGLARHVSGSGPRTVAGTPLGTPGYMAPEQAAGQPDAQGPATDVYGVGAVLYKLLTGRPPFHDDDPLAVLEQVRSRPPVPPRQLRPEVPADLETVCLTCLRKDPAERYASAADLAADLSRFRRAEPIRPPRPRRWRRVALAAVVGLAILLPLVLAAWWWPQTVVPFKGDIDLVVTEEGNSRRQLLRLYEPAALPLKAGDEVRVEASLNRLAYAYILWIDTQGQVQPVYPWIAGDWNRREPEEQVRSLSLPKEPGHVWTNQLGPSGMETLVLLVRETPLPEGEDLRERLGELGPQQWLDPLAVAWFENGEVLRGQAQRAPNLKETQAGSNPAVRTQQLLRERLEGLFEYSRAVSFGNRGG